MTKEELEKEAEEYTNKLLEDWELYDPEALQEAYVAGAEPREKRIAELEKENTELRKVAAFQQSSNMNRYFENKKLKEGLAVGSTFNKALNSMNKNLEEERDKYRDMVFDLQKENAELKETVIKMNKVITETFSNLTKAKEIIKDLCGMVRELNKPNVQLTNVDYSLAEAEQFLNSEGK